MWFVLVKYYVPFERLLKILISWIVLIKEKLSSLPPVERKIQSIPLCASFLCVSFMLTLLRPSL